MLELGKDLFDGIEIGIVRRQEEELCSDLAYGLSHRFPLVGAGIVHDDDVAGRERGNENLLDISRERSRSEQPQPNERSHRQEGAKQHAREDQGNRPSASDAGLPSSQHLESQSAHNGNPKKIQPNVIPL
jgi:hypothetical protein